MSLTNPPAHTSRKSRVRHGDGLGGGRSPRRVPVRRPVDGDVDHGRSVRANASIETRTDRASSGASTRTAARRGRTIGVDRFHDGPQLVGVDEQRKRRERRCSVPLVGQSVEVGQVVTGEAEVLVERDRDEGRGRRDELRRAGRLTEIEPGRGGAPHPRPPVGVGATVLVDALDEPEAFEVAQVVTAGRRRRIDHFGALCRRLLAHGQQEVEDRRADGMSERRQHRHVGHLHALGRCHGPPFCEDLKQVLHIFGPHQGNCQGIPSDHPVAMSERTEGWAARSSQRDDQPSRHSGWWQTASTLLPSGSRTNAP